MAPMVPLGTAAISTVRQRLKPPHKPLRDRAAKRRRVERLVIRHFATSASALYVGVGVGLSTIWRHQTMTGRPHMASLHSWLGVGALGVWGAAYLSAQPHIWRDQIRARRWEYKPRWLWASVTHRRLGHVAYAAALAAASTGLLRYGAVFGAVSRSRAWACAAVAAAIGWSTLGSPSRVSGAVRAVCPMRPRAAAPPRGQDEATPRALPG